MALSPRDRRALILGGIALGLLVLYFLVLEPLAVGYHSLLSEHQRLAARVARTIRDKQKAEYYTERIAEYQQTVGELSAPKPYDQQITTVGEQIIAAAQKSGLQLRGSTPTAATPWADDPSLEMALFHIDAGVKWDDVRSAGRQWESVFKFIAGLYRIPGVLSVERLGLSGDPQKGGGRGPNQGGGKMTVRLTVSVLVEAAPESEDLWAD